MKSLFIKYEVDKSYLQNLMTVWDFCVWNKHDIKFKPGTNPFQ